MSARLSWSLATALAAHVAAYAWMVRGSRVAVRSGPALASVDEIAFDLESEPRPASAEDRPSAVAAGPDDRIDERFPRTAASHRAAGTRPPEPRTEESASPPTSSGAGAGWTFSPTTSSALPTGGALAGRALDAAVRAGVRATLEQDDAEAAAHGRAILPPFRSRDLALGLAPGGVLVGIARDLVRRSLVPDVSRAVLRFDTDAAGLIASARVLDASSGRRDWEEVAAQIAAAARARPALTVPRGWRGLSITIEVTSEMRTASGARTTGGLLEKALGALDDPIGTATTTPLQRIVTSRMVEVTAF